jgi:putative transposase
MLKTLNLTQSMSRKGNCHDNAPIESWFNLIKMECINRQKINNINDLKNVISEYVDWFNNVRISSKLKGLTPVEYRNQTLSESIINIKI